MGIFPILAINFTECGAGYFDTTMLPGATRGGFRTALRVRCNVINEEGGHAGRVRRAILAGHRASQLISNGHRAHEIERRHYPVIISGRLPHAREETRTFHWHCGAICRRHTNPQCVLPEARSGIGDDRHENRGARSACSLPGHTGVDHASAVAVHSVRWHARKILQDARRGHHPFGGFARASACRDARPHAIEPGHH